MHPHFALKASQSSVAVTVLNTLATVGITLTFERLRDGAFKAPTVSMAPTAFADRDLTKLVRAMRQADIATPYRLVQFCQSMMGRQAVYDQRMEKYRLIGVAKDGENTYQAVGLPLTVNSADQDLATRRLARRATEWMMEAPDKAAEIAVWFGNKCPVKQVESGKVPDAVPLESILATGEKITEVKPNVLKIKREKKIDAQKKV